MFTHTNRERDSQPQMAFLMKYLSGTNCIQFVRNFGWVVIESIIIIVCCVQTALWMRENIYFNSSLFVICDHYNNTKLTRLHSISMCATLYRVSMNINWLFGHKQILVSASASSSSFSLSLCLSISAKNNGPISNIVKMICHATAHAESLWEFNFKHLMDKKGTIVSNFRRFYVIIQR